MLSILEENMEIPRNPRNDTENNLEQPEIYKLSPNHKIASFPPQYKFLLDVPLERKPGWRFTARHT